MQELIRQKIYWFTFTSCFSNAIWEGNVLSSFSFIIANESNFLVGLLTGAMGIMNILMMPLAGWLADRFDKHSILRWCGVVGIFATVVTSLAIIQSNYLYLLISMACWGVYRSGISPTLDALLAEVAGSENSSSVFSWRMSLVFFGSSAGPFLSAILFYFLGDKWTLFECQVVLIFGQIVGIASLLLLFTFSKTLNGQDNDSSNLEYSKVSSVDDAEGHIELEDIDPSVDIETSEVDEKVAVLENVVDNAELCSNSLASTSDPLSSPSSSDSPSNLSWFIPALIAGGDIIGGFASGMTVCIIFTVATLGQSIGVNFSQKVSEMLGRISTVLSFKTLGIVGLFSLAFLTSLHFSRIVLVVVFILRTILMNSCRALTKSIIMDLVPPCERGRWSSLELINAATWSGSAVIGGYLIDKYGILQNFYVTGILQFLSLGPLFYLRVFVPSSTKL